MDINNSLRGLVIVLLLVFNVVQVHASGLANLMQYAQRNGTMTNINKGKVVSDQQAGYVTGGSIISRGPKPETLRPLIVQPPSFEFDPCSGSYDARFGGFSFIRGEAFTRFIVPFLVKTPGFSRERLQSLCYNFTVLVISDTL
jgi:hypothetical protein